MKVSCETAALTADDRALEDLDALLVALDHLHVDLQGVAGGEVGHVVAQAGLVDDVGGLHVMVSSGGARSCGARGRRA